MNYLGAIIGFLIGVCIILIAVSFFMLTWDFWLGLVNIGGMDMGI